MVLDSSHLEDSKIQYMGGGKKGKTESKNIYHELTHCGFTHRVASEHSLTIFR